MFRKNRWRKKIRIDREKSRERYQARTHVFLKGKIEGKDQDRPIKKSRDIEVEHMCSWWVVRAVRVDDQSRFRVEFQITRLDHKSMSAVQ